MNKPSSELKTHASEKWWMGAGRKQEGFICESSGSPSADLPISLALPLRTAQEVQINTLLATVFSLRQHFLIVQTLDLTIPLSGTLDYIGNN